jgi:hypothetical protein
VDVPRRQGGDHERGGLAAAVAAARYQERNELRQPRHVFQLRLVGPQGEGRQQGGEEEDRQPQPAMADEL